MATVAPTAAFWRKRVAALVIRVPRKNHFHHVTQQQQYYAFIRPLSKMQHVPSSFIAPPFITAVKKEPMSLRNVHSKASDSQSSSQGVANFVLGDIGEGIAEVELLRWFVAPGDHLTQFQKVCEVQSDKATVEITSRFEGTVLDLKHEEGETIPTGSILLTLTTTSPDGISPPPPPLRGKTATTPPQVKNTAEKVENTKTEISSKILTSPAVRKLLWDNNLDDTFVRDLIPSSGPGGRLLKSDVLSFLNRGGDSVAFEVGEEKEYLKDSSSGVVVQNGRHEEEQLSHYESPRRVLPEPDKTVRLSSIQKSMARKMDSALSIPHMLFCDEIVADQLLDARNEIRKAHAKDFLKMSHLPIVIKAVSLALADYPQMNSSLSPCRTEIVLHAEHNIGIAIDSPRGLVVPYIRSVQRLSILDIAKELRRLRDGAIDGKLSLDDLGLEDGAKQSKITYSISNIGSLGGTYCSPIITPPQVGIAGVGRICRVPRFASDDSNEVVAVNILNVSYSADHRVIDGATLARFSNKCKLYLEHPATMLSVSH